MLESPDFSQNSPHSTRALHSGAETKKWDKNRIRTDIVEWKNKENKIHQDSWEINKHFLTPHFHAWIIRQNCSKQGHASHLYFDHNHTCIVRSQCSTMIYRGVREVIRFNKQWPMKLSIKWLHGLIVMFDSSNCPFIVLSLICFKDKSERISVYLCV